MRIVGLRGMSAWPWARSRKDSSTASMASFIVSTDARSSRVKKRAKLFCLLRIWPDETSYGFPNWFSVTHLDQSTDDREYRQSSSFPSMPWRRLVLTVKFVGIDRSLFIHVDNGDISV